MRPVFRGYALPEIGVARPHVFGRTVATLVSEQASLNLTSALLGHTDPQVTIEHCIRRDEHVNLLTAELLDEAFAREDDGRELASQHQAELLMWLLLHPEQEYGVTEMAARLGVPLSTLHREVNRLDEAGLVASRTQGRNRLIRANVDHPAAKALTQLLEITFGSRAVIAEELAIQGAEQVVIFGSWAARYEGRTGPPPNDIDVLVVGKVDRADVYDPADRTNARLGIEVNPFVRTAKQWAAPEDALVAQIKESAHVTVLGARESVAH